MKVLIVVFLVLAIIPAYSAADDWSMKKCKMMCAPDKGWSKTGDDDMFSKKIGCSLANAEELELSDEQVSKLKALKYSVKKNMIKKDADIEIYALDIKEEMLKDEADINILKGLIDKKYSAKAEKAKDLAEACVNAKNILTKDQQKKLKDIWSECKMGKMGHAMMKGKSENPRMGSLN